MTINQQIVLASRPTGAASVDNFRLETSPLPAVPDGHVLVRHHYLSLDPYMRMRMNDTKSYAAAQTIGAVMLGGTVGEVIESRSDKFVVGDKVAGSGGWQEYGLVDVRQPGTLRKLDVSAVPLSAYLGAVGMPGITAWYGLTQIIAPQAGETIVVSAASGAVGTVVGQLAKARGCRAVGLAGGPEKCAFVVDGLGFDACIDYKAHADAASLRAALKAACPDGIDGNFENVGGAILNAVLGQMNAFGRMAMCGMISGYDGASVPLEQPALILTQRLKLQGFIVSEHLQFWAQARDELAAMVVAGSLKYRETVAQGIASAPQAFLGLLKGRNFGKQLVKLV